MITRRLGQIKHTGYNDLQEKFNDMLLRNGLCLEFITKMGLEDDFMTHMRQVVEYEKDTRYKEAATNFLKLYDQN